MEAGYVRRVNVVADDVVVPSGGSLALTQALIPAVGLVTKEGVGPNSLAVEAAPCTSAVV